MAKLSKFEEALQSYEEKFNANYPLTIGMEMSDDDIINDIKKCIKLGKPAKEPIYDNGADY